MSWLCWKGGLKLKPSETSDTADDTITALGPPGLFPFGGPPRWRTS